MRFSVVIPTYNRQGTLRQTLAALTTQDYPDYEIVVVDDGSTDGTEEMARREFPQARYFRQGVNRGPAAARNRGIQAATGEIIAFTDDDCVPPPDWLSRLADGYARYPQVTGIGGYLKAPDHLLSSNILAQYERSVGRDDYGAGDHEIWGGHECPAGGTNNMSYRHKALLDIGGFDETFPFAAGEDADLKWRLCQDGAQLLYVPVSVTHLQSYTWAGFRRQQLVRGRGVVHFERKHLRHPNRLRVIFRLTKRALLLVRDVAAGHDCRLAIVRFAARWYDGLGQWAEIGKLEKQRNAIQSPN